MSRRNPKPIIQSKTAPKGHGISRASKTTRPDFEINHVNILENEIENLKDKISTSMPSMNNKVFELHEVWVIKTNYFIFVLVK